MSVRPLACVVGRRNLLRYLAVGAGAVVVSACSGNGTGGGLRAQALKAFAVGTWGWTANRDGGSGTVTIGDGTETVRSSMNLMSGTWTYENGTVDISAEGLSSYLKILDVPADIPNEISKLLRCRGELGKGEAKCNGSRLRLAFNDNDLVLTGLRSG
ncbi:hypothetical protein [Streptomyces sp. NPDC048295]|uniref:hypothetical protein n=1 Tax=Streptomyces sp. NPDC048295 TaxID=3154617 RepID=UPI00342E62A3